MKKVVHSTLAITIPTYNRASLLKFLLDSIFQDFKLKVWPDDLDLIIIDNASIDNTVQLIENYISDGYPIKIIKNDTNIGVDANLCKCFESVNARYIWQIGDDEILYGGTVEWILNFCRNNDFSLLHLASNGFVSGQQNEQIIKTISTNIDIEKLNSDQIFRNVNVYLTFISANIINKANLLDLNPNFTAKSELNTNLAQLAWIYGALNMNSDNYYVKTPMLGALSGNSGGYKLVKVFGENLIQITDRYLKKYNPNAANIMSNAVLTRLFPSEIYSQSKIVKNEFDSEEMEKSLDQLFNNKIYYKIFVKPLFSSSKIFRKISLFITLNFNKINRLLRYRFL